MLYTIIIAQVLLFTGFPMASNVCWQLHLREMYVFLMKMSDAYDVSSFKLFVFILLFIRVIVDIFYLLYR